MSTPTEYETIRAELIEDGGVLRLLLNQPKANILSMAMVRDLGAALDAHRDDSDLKLVVLRGAGGRFSYGASIQEHLRDVAPAMLAGFHAFVRKLSSYPVPTAALAEGPCLGGGFEVVLCCNLIFAAEGTTFACPEIKLGVIPPVLATVGRHRLGGPTMERLLLTGGNLPAVRAYELGLVTEVFADGTDPEEQLLAWYRANLAPLSAFALRRGTRVARAGAGWVESVDADLAAAEQLYVDEILTSHDGNEGIEAFLEKRPPQWTNA